MLGRNELFLIEFPLFNSCGSDRTISVVDWDKGSNSASTTTCLKGHASVVHSIAFSERGNIIASGDEDGSIHLWELNGMKPQFTAVGTWSLSPDLLFVGDTQRYQPAVLLGNSQAAIEQRAEMRQEQITQQFLTETALIWMGDDQVIGAFRPSDLNLKEIG